MLGLKLRDEFLGSQTPGTMIQLRDGSGTGAAERGPEYILSITYPTADVQTAIKNVSTGRTNRPIVLMGDRGRGKSHILAVAHHAIASPDVVEGWAHQWGAKLNGPLADLSLLRGFHPISEAVHNHEYKFLWDLLFDRHPQGKVYRKLFEKSGKPYPARSLLAEMFEEQPTALILDEFQKWFDGLSDRPGAEGIKYRTWAENFIQNLSELSKDRPDILILVVSVLNNATEAFRQIHRDTPVVIDFRGPTARTDRQHLLLHRLFENRDNLADAANYPFEDCVGAVPTAPNILLWHSWLDDLIHVHKKALDAVHKTARTVLAGDGFWSFVNRLRQGRRLVITADHGYAVSNWFSSALKDEGTIEILRTAFGASRCIPADSPWPQRSMPPAVCTGNGFHLVMGQCKWPVQGGFPALCHGGLSLLEVAVPWIELPAL